MLSFIEKHNKFPTTKDLRPNDCDLDAAIQRYGYNYFRSKLGYSILQASPHHYTNEMLKEWLASVILFCKKVPTQKELNDIDSKKQANLARRGGVTPFLKELATDEPEMFSSYFTKFMNRNCGRRKKHV